MSKVLDQLHEKLLAKLYAEQWRSPGEVGRDRSVWAAFSSLTMLEREAVLRAALEILDRPHKDPYTWIAWSEARERICDAGSALATSHEDAFAIASACLGGPHAASVMMFEISDVTTESTIRRTFRVDGTEVTK